MKKTITAAAVLVVLAVVTFAATLPQPKEVTVEGQMLCLSCDILSSYAAKDEPNPPMDKCACAAVLKSTEGRIYTLAPTKLGGELGEAKMRGRYVRAKAQQVPGSLILVVESFEAIKKTEPKASEGPAFGFNNW